jgi:hypothetical protein
MRLEIAMPVCVVALSFAGAPAWADAIDGAWCHSDGRRMRIDGPAVVTPAGNSVSGDYSRHYLTYVSPPAEPGAGETVVMTLLNEMTVRVRVGNGGEETWRRCGPPVSRLDRPRIEQGTGNG